MSARRSEGRLTQRMAKKGVQQDRAQNLAQPKQRKYRNKPTVVDNIRFDSKREAARWQELKLLERAGKITNLTRQVKFPLDVEGVHIANYWSDFCYDEDGEVVVEDVKSTATKTRVYLIKKNLMRALYRIAIRET